MQQNVSPTRRQGCLPADGGGRDLWITNHWWSLHSRMWCWFLKWYKMCSELIWFENQAIPAYKYKYIYNPIFPITAIFCSTQSKRECCLIRIWLWLIMAHHIPNKTEVVELVANLVWKLSSGHFKQFFLVEIKTFRFGETSNFGMTSLIWKWIWWFIMIHLEFMANLSWTYQRCVYDVCSTWQHDDRLQEVDPNEMIYRCDWKHFEFTWQRPLLRHLMTGGIPIKESWMLN